MPDEQNTTTTVPTPEPPKVVTLSEADWAKVQKDLDYLHTILFAVTTTSLKDTYKDTKLTADEIQTMFLDVQGNDDIGDAECTALLFVSGLKARKRSIDYSADGKLAKVKAAGQDRYNRWAEANPKLATNPLTNLPTMFAYGIISEGLFKVMMDEATKVNQVNQSAAAASL